MRTLCFLIFAAFSIVPSSAAEAKAGTDEIRYPNDITPLNIRPSYEHGFLAVYDQMTKVYGPDGSLLLRFQPSKGTVANAAIDVDGTVALAIEEVDPFKGSISILNREGVQTKLIETSEYIPSGICFAADHTLWVIGGQHGKGEDYNLLRHYSRDGRELGKFLPRSSFPAGGNPAGMNIGLVRIRTSNERVGAFLDGWRDEKPFWVETTLDGREAGRWRLSQDAIPTAFTHSGVVYAEGNGGPLMLDRSTGGWTAAILSNSGTLLGADERKLVFLVRPATVVKTDSE